jgi:hypothetical protein
MVDPVDYSTLGETLNNPCMAVKVDLFELLKDVDFFSKAVENCEKNRAIEIDKIERGGVIEEEKPKME